MEPTNTARTAAQREPSDTDGQQPTLEKVMGLRAAAFAAASTARRRTA